MTLTFDEPVETALGSLRLLDASGTVQSVGPAVHPAGAPQRIAVDVGALPRGRYVVEWRVVSADSHIVHGAYSFGVGTDAGPAPPAGADSGAELLLPILHFGILAGALLGAGLPLGILAFGLGSKEARYPGEVAGWCTLGVAAFADLALRADLAGGSLALAATTRVGELRLSTIAAAVAGIVALVSKRRNWSITAATWIGLLAVGTTLEPDAHLRRISPIAASAVGLIVITGIVQTLHNAGSLQALLTTAYGHAIDFKIAGLALALAVAAAAQRALARQRLAIGRLLKLELWLLTGVIAVTAVLVESPVPALH